MNYIPITDSGDEQRNSAKGYADVSYASEILRLDHRNKIQNSWFLKSSPLAQAAHSCAHS